MANFNIQEWDFIDFENKIKTLRIDFQNKKASINNSSISYEDGLIQLGWILKFEIERDKEKIKELDC